jgi:hypothetical protein
MFSRIVLAAAVSVFSSAAFASGWNCETADGEYSVKRYNSRTSTRTPAALILSSEDGTLLSAHGSEIKKRTVSRGTRYTAETSRSDAFHGSVVFWVNHIEGSDTPVADGEEVDGKLVINWDGEQEKFDLTCARYLVD